MNLTKIAAPWIPVLLIMAVGAADMRSKSELPVSPTVEPPRDTAPLFQSLDSPVGFTLYEGLPRPSSGQEAYAQERMRTDIFFLGVHAFYKEPVSLSAVDATQLREIVAHKDSHLEYRGPKLCGGFHPDYVVMWNDGTFGAMICFGCHEWGIFTPQDSYYEDIERSAYEKLRTILSRYVINRPAAQKTE